MKTRFVALSLVFMMSAGLLQSCGDGVLVKGEKGDPGDVGPMGPQGPAGTPGSVITQIKLCQDDTSAYPEYALRIDNQIYAVYWGVTPTSNGQKQAFLALIIPGTYQSTGGNGCYFRVNTDGSVTRL